MKKEKQKFYIEFKVEGNDRIQQINAQSSTQEGAKRQVRAMFGKGIKLKFIEVTNHKKLTT